MLLSKLRIMLTVAVVNYTIVALIGIYLLIKLFSKNPSPVVVGIIHGSLGLLGLAFLIIFISFQSGETPFESVLIFLLAFFIGAGMLAAKLTGKKFPLMVAFIHVAVALSGIYFLYKFWLAF